MKNKIFLATLILILISGGIVSSQNRSIAFDESSWKNILARAKKENKMIFLDCYTTWCGPCKWMAKNVFTNDTVADFYNANFINAKIDMEKGEGVDLAKEYGIKAFPTTLYINGDGEQIHRTCGSCPAPDFIDMGKAALDPEKQLSVFTKKFNSGTRDPAFMLSYLTLLRNGCQNYEPEVESYFSSQKEALTSRINWSIIYNFVNGYSSKEFEYLLANKSAFTTLYTVDSVENKINQVFQKQFRNEKDKKELDQIKAKLRAAGTKNAERMILESDFAFYLNNKDWKNYAATAIEFTKNYSDLNANNLNAMAWTFYDKIDDRAMLEKAAEWAKKATEMKDLYAFNDTYAALLYKLGKKKEAKAAAEKAIELAKISGDDHKETDDLLKKINKLK